MELSYTSPRDWSPLRAAASQQSRARGWGSRRGAGDRGATRVARGDAPPESRDMRHRAGFIAPHAGALRLRGLSRLRAASPRPSPWLSRAAQRRLVVFMSAPAPTSAAPTAHAASENVASSFAPRLQDIPPPPSVLTGPPDEMATRYDFESVEAEIYQWWESAGLFKPCEENGREPFVVCMPPPNVTGGLHMGHALGTALQDIMIRFHRMKGRPTLFLPGTDHAGIATQLQVEKALAKEGVRRVDLGREKFLDAVWDWKRAKGGYICEQMRRLGASCDWSRHRFTLEDDVSAAVREAFVRLHDRGLVYRGDYMVNWSPSLMTAVSDLEVDFSDEEGSLYYFNYPLAGDELKGQSIPVATTRPETILGDTAVCVHPDDPRYKRFIGQSACVPMVGRVIPVIADEYVDMEFGTGALKVTPGHDTNDYELGKRHNLPIINIMNKDASINSCAGPAYENLDRFAARERLWADMERAGLTVKVEPHMNRVPRSQRGGDVIEPLVSTQWFVRMKSLAEPAVEAVRDGTIRIVPERFEKVYYNWLDDIRDWCVSRQLWWGHRIPVWHVQEYPGDYIVARDEAEARAKADAKYAARPVTLNQDPDVLDTWFSSALWPFATMGWPNVDKPDYKMFHPGAVMETGYDILFFWVARMIMMGVGLTGQTPFDVVYMHGLVRDSTGRKMSKTVGNVIDPLDTIAMYGTDALRYSLVTGTTPGQDVPLSMEKVEANRNFANKLWNACRYVLSNLDTVSDDERRELANLALVGWGSEAGVSALPLPERYIVSKLHLLVEAVGDGLETLEFGDVGRRIYEFLWDEFADWYVEVSKTRLYGEDEAAARTARATLVYVLDTCLRLLHPFMPYVTEALWHRFPRDRESERALICAAWPAGGTVDHDAIRRFERMQTLIRSIRNARAEYQVIPSKRVPLVVRADATTAGDVADEAAMLVMLAKLDPDALTIEGLSTDVRSGGSDGAKVDESSIHLVVCDGLEAFLPMKGMLDVAKETARLGKQLGKAESDLDGLHRRLNAPNFAHKAPPKVIGATREAARELEEKIATLRGRIVAVEGLRGPED
jgi:valyl-tRNA synthetase